MLGGYPRLVTAAPITSRMVRWRGVSVDSVDRDGRSESVSRVSLSLIRPNVAAFRQDIKHVFEVCRVLLVGMVAESCRCRVLSSSACATVRSHVRFSNTLSIMIRTSDRLQADWRTAH